ncbi:unnamed protein product, partial [Thlaspi arvense]
MYSDRVEAETASRKTVKNRLNVDFSSRGRQVTRKRERQDDDKWEHDLFDDDKPRVSSRRVDPKDLRLKLQKRHHGLQSRVGGGATLAVGDLRQKLSGTMNSQTRSTNPPKTRTEAARTAVKKVPVETKSETRTALNKATKKTSQQADTSVDSFLESLGLEKYATSFQVEEVDMDALMHMTDDDLKALLIPMGPRKKILLALGSKEAKGSKKFRNKLVRFGISSWEVTEAGNRVDDRLNQALIKARMKD